MPVREFELPDVGEGVAEGELVRWLVEPGDSVTEDQPVAEVETDKALVEIPSPVDGSVKELRAAEGDVVPVGEVFVVFEVGEAGEPSGTDERGDVDGAIDVGERPQTDEPSEAGGPTRDGDRAERVFAPPSARRLARELGVDLAAVSGSGPGGRVTDADVRAAAESESEAEQVTETGASQAPTMETAPPPAAETATRERTLAAPATRRLAEELGVDLDAVPTDETRDGEAFVTPEAVRAYATTEAEPERGEGPERVPYRGIRRTIGEHVARSAFTAPHVTHHDSVDASALVELRAELKPAAAEAGVSLTYLPFVLKAVVAALREHPEMNASLDEEAEEIVRYGDYHVGVATATDAGLVVPVVRDADEKGLLELAESASDLVERARDRTISREEMQGGTFTVTNFGAVGGEYATPIINYPEVAILGLGAIVERPWVVDGEVVARPVLPLSLSIDHRVVDGATAAAFTNRLKELLGRPAALLLE